MTRLALERAGHSERVGVTARRERCHDEGLEVSVQLIGGDNHTGSGLPNLAPAGRVEIDQEDVPPTNQLYRQRHSSVSNRVEVGLSSNPPSPRSRMRRAASAQPARGVTLELITTAPPRTWSWTCSLRPASSMTGLGRRTPRELPIRISRAFMGTVVTTLYPRAFRLAMSAYLGTSQRQCSPGWLPGRAEPDPFARASRHTAPTQLRLARVPDVRGGWPDTPKKCGAPPPRRRPRERQPIVGSLSLQNVPASVTGARWSRVGSRCIALHDPSRQRRRMRPRSAADRSGSRASGPTNTPLRRATGD